jgi:NADH-quinone oxidoreductase subunit N
MIARTVLFYLASYGIMNAAAFAVLMLLPAKPPPPWDRSARVSASASAETLDDLAGAGIRHLGLGLAMTVACFSLIGLPLTVGFFGKFYLIQAAWRGEFFWLIVIMMINAAISAGYYLRIIATMFLRPETSSALDELRPAPALARFHSYPLTIAIALSCGMTLVLGTLFPATELLNTRAMGAATIDTDMGAAPNAAMMEQNPAPAKIAASSRGR